MVRTGASGRTAVESLGLACFTWLIAGLTLHESGAMECIRCSPQSTSNAAAIVPYDLAWSQAAAPGEALHKEAALFLKAPESAACPR